MVMLVANYHFLYRIANFYEVNARRSDLKTSLFHSCRLCHAYARNRENLNRFVG